MAIDAVWMQENNLHFERRAQRMKGGEPGDWKKKKQPAPPIFNLNQP